MDRGVIGRLIKGIEGWTKLQVREKETGDEARRGNGKGMTEDAVAVKARL